MSRHSLARSCRSNGARGGRHGGGRAGGGGAPGDTWGVPVKATITLTGHGYGHGHGMSQYGAEGAARQGLTAQQIVAFYYPGTVPGTTNGQVSVQISADTTDDLEVLARPGLTLRDLSSREKVALPARGRAGGGWSPTPGTSRGCSR